MTYDVGHPDTLRDRRREARISELVEEVAFLRHELKLDPERGLLENLICTFGLSLTEGRVLAMLYTTEPNRLVTREKVMVALYSARPNDAPDHKVVDVWMSTIRRRLRKKLGLTAMGRGLQNAGWRLTPLARDEIRRALGRDPSAQTHRVPLR